MPDLGDLARKLSALDLEAAQQRGASKAAQLVKKSTLAELTKVVPSGRLRNLRNAKLSVNYAPVRKSPHVVVQVQARGPWPIVERGTKAHAIGPRARGRRATGKKAVVTPFGVYARVRHPGTKGSEPWANGIVKASPQVPELMMDEIRAELARQFRRG